MEVATATAVDLNRSLWLRRIFVAAREARFYGRDQQLPALEHGDERMIKSKSRRLEELGAHPGPRFRVEAAEVVEAQSMIERLAELLNDFAAEFGRDAQEMAVEVVQADLHIKRLAAGA